MKKVIFILLILAAVIWTPIVHGKWTQEVDMHWCCRGMEQNEIEIEYPEVEFVVTSKPIVNKEKEIDQPVNEEKVDEQKKDCLVDKEKKEEQMDEQKKECLVDKEKKEEKVDEQEKVEMNTNKEEQDAVENNE